MEKGKKPVTPSKEHIDEPPINFQQQTNEIIYRQVPWSDWVEWTQVYRQLFPKELSEEENIASKWKGLKRVSAWRTRGRVPVAIDSTANLIEIFLKHNQQSNWESTNNQSEAEQRLLCSMTLIRFVNGIVDVGQKAYARSVGDIADEMGLPRSFVELRHDATHGQLPSLEVLKSSCVLALNWLEENYWKRQYFAIYQVKDELIHLLSEYRKLSKELAKLSKKEISAEQKKEQKDLLDEIIAITPSITVRDVLVPILLDNYFLIPKSKNFKEYTSLPERYLGIWRNAIIQFNSCWSDFLPALILASTERALSITLNQSEEEEYGESSEIKASTHRASLLAAWTITLLDPEISFSQKILRSGSRFPFTSIMKLCLQHHDSKWSPVILSVILKRFPESNDFSKKVEHLFLFKREADKISGKESQDKNSSKRRRSSLLKSKENPPEISISQFEAMVKSNNWRNQKQKNIDDADDMDVEPIDQPDSQKGVNGEQEVQWRLCNEWISCPVGLLPRQDRIPNLELPYELDHFVGASFPIIITTVQEPERLINEQIVIESKAKKRKSSEKGDVLATKQSDIIENKGDHHSQQLTIRLLISPNELV